MTFISEGSSSARVNLLTSSQSSTDIRQLVALASGLIYTVSLDVYATNNEARARIFGPSFSPSAFSDEFVLNQWQTITFDYTATSTGDVEFGIRFYDTENWTGVRSLFYIDNFQVVAQGTTLTLFDGPPNGANIDIAPEQANNASVSFVTTNFNMSTDNGAGTGIGGEGFIKWSVEDISNNDIVASGDIFALGEGVDQPEFSLVVGESYILYAELVENDGATPVTPATNYTLNVTVVDYIQVANLAALRAGTISDEVFYEVTGEVINTYSVGNPDNEMYFQDSSAGIKVSDFEGFLTTSYAEGEGVTNIKGWLELINGLLQFRPTGLDWGAPSSSGSPITPEIVDIDTLTDDGLAIGAALDAYESELVQINGAVFANANGAAVFEEAFFETGNYDITDSSGTMIFRSIFGDYIGEIIPGGNQNLVVLVGRFFNEGQVTARRLTDFSLSTRENQIEGFSFSPNPTSLGYVNISSRSQTTIKVNVFDILGKQVINSTVKNNRLDVSSLNTGIYIMRVSQNNAITTKKLVIQ